MTENHNISSATQSDIVISTRIRLARNLKDQPFPRLLRDQDAENICDKVRQALSGDTPCGHFTEYKMSELSSIDAVSFVERHLISPEFLSSKAGRSLFLNDKETVAVMVNEEDHIRIQSISEGLQLKAAYLDADRMDDFLNAKLDFAFDSNLGYLTECPTNLGTGMRASLMVHLPALKKTGSISRIAQSLLKLGLVIRGTYGESSEAKGALYQISNQITLGISEKTALDNLYKISMQLIKRERSVAENIAKNIDVVDTVFRCLGTLKYAKLISTDEAMNLLSSIRFGIANGMIKSDTLSADVLNRLISDIQPATLMKRAGKNMDNIERDEERAKLLSSCFSGI